MPVKTYLISGEIFTPQNAIYFFLFSIVSARPRGTLSPRSAKRSCVKIPVKKIERLVIYSIPEDPGAVSGAGEKSKRARKKVKKAKNSFAQIFFSLI